MLRSWMIAGLALLLATAGLAQSWRTAYEEGLKAARDARWADARTAFKGATAFRPEDQSGATSLPGPVTEQRRWRDGAPYSPNFLAAYSSYRQGVSTTDAAEAASHLRTAATEFEALLSKGQYSQGSFYFLMHIYSRLADKPARQKVDATYQQVAEKVNFRVDLEPVTPEDQALIAQMFESVGDANPVVKAGGDTNPVVIPGRNTGGTPLIAPPVGRVPMVDTKYALIIGNAESRIDGNSVPFAVEDTTIIKEALVGGAGYPEANISIITNATAEQMMQAANALSERVADGGTVLIYFAGVGSHLDGKDYLAGVNTTMLTDSSSMLPKFELYRPFIMKGAQVFAFFETNRPVMSSGYFGMETNMIGAVSQVYGTLRGSTVYGLIRDGKQVGMFAEAMAGVIMDLKSNRLPIVEFGWQLFYKIRNGRPGSSGVQTPTLPLRTNMGADARF